MWGGMGHGQPTAPFTCQVLGDLGSRPHGQDGQEGTDFWKLPRVMGFYESHT